MVQYVLCAVNIVWILADSRLTGAVWVSNFFKARTARLLAFQKFGEPFRILAVPSHKYKNPARRRGFYIYVDFSFVFLNQVVGDLIYLKGIL